LFPDLQPEGNGTGGDAAEFDQLFASIPGGVERDGIRAVGLAESGSESAVAELLVTS
jgi:hypothetical protein